MGRDALRLLPYLLVPLLLLLDALYYTLARPSCPACASFTGFYQSSSLTIAYLTQLAVSPRPPSI